MATEWKPMRVPAALHGRLAKLAADFEDKQTRGIMQLPSEFADRGGVPLWFVIEKALGVYEDKRRRSARKKPRTAAAGQ